MYCMYPISQSTPHPTPQPLTLPSPPFGLINANVANHNINSSHAWTDPLTQGHFVALDGCGQMPRHQQSPMMPPTPNANAFVPGVTSHIWTHNIPQQMPWAVNPPNGHTDGVIRFTAQATQPAMPAAAAFPTTHTTNIGMVQAPFVTEPKTSSATPTIHQPHSYHHHHPIHEKVSPLPKGPVKRNNSSSSDEDDDDLDDLQPPTKMCATAEKVAAKFGSLDLNKDSRIEIVELTEDDEIDESDKTSDGQTIELSSEARYLMSTESGENCVLQKLIKSSVSSSTALIPWTPTPFSHDLGRLKSFLRQPYVETPSSPDENDESQSRNDHDGVTIEEMNDEDDPQVAFVEEDMVEGEFMSE